MRHRCSGHAKTANPVETATLFDIRTVAFRENRVLPFPFPDVPMKHLRILCLAATVMLATTLLGGCGLFGCAAALATNGSSVGGIGGCHVGTRF